MKLTVEAKPMTKPRDRKDAAAAFERALAQPPRGSYVLRLYVAGMTRQSLRAVANIKHICEEHMKGRYNLEVIDLYQQPQLAGGEQIIAAPTLIKKLPEPLRRVIGDFSNVERVLVGLDLRPREGRRPTGSA